MNMGDSNEARQTGNIASGCIGMQQAPQYDRELYEDRRLRETAIRLALDAHGETQGDAGYIVDYAGTLLKFLRGDEPKTEARPKMSDAEGIYRSMHGERLMMELRSMQRAREPSVCAGEWRGMNVYLAREDAIKLIQQEIDARGRGNAA